MRAVWHLKERGPRVAVMGRTLTVWEAVAQHTGSQLWHCTVGLPQVVLVSSMGVTKPDHPLNRIGDGKILVRPASSPRQQCLAG